MKKSSSKSDHIRLMLRAYETAAGVFPFADPNPTAGAVAVTGDSCEFTGHSAFAGGSHAEINAIRAAGKHSVRHLYVTLEPCCFHGRTGACTDAIMAAGIPEVSIHRVDTHPSVSGRGLQILREKGIIVNELPDSALEIPAFFTLDGFLTRMVTGRPRRVLKWAESADGFIAPLTGPSGAILSRSGMALMHRIRSIFRGVLVTPGAVREDRPSLNVRFSGASVANTGANYKALEGLFSPRNENSSLRGVRLFLLPADWTESDIVDFRNRQRHLPGRYILFTRNDIQTEGKDLVRLPVADLTNRILWEHIHENTGSFLLNNLLIEAGPSAGASLLDERIPDALLIFRSGRIMGSGRPMHPDFDAGNGKWPADFRYIGTIRTADLTDELIILVRESI